MTRLFVALTVPAAAAEAAERVIAPLRDSEWRWVPTDRWHVTVEFIGDADPGESAQRWARRVDAIAPLGVRLAGAGAFPRVRSGRVLWIGVDCDVQAWQRLAGDDQQPHMTVARSRRSVDMTDTVEALAGHRGPEWIAAELVLFDSRPGPVYTAIDRFPLGGPAFS